MWFIYTFAAILMWSGSDLFCKLGSAPDDRYSHLKITGAVGLVMGLHALYTILAGDAGFSLRDIVTYLPVSALYILSMLLGYIGLRYIALSVSSPICNSSGAVTALLCFLFLGQSMSPVQAFAVGVICAGIVALGFIERRAQLALPDAGSGKKASGIIGLIFPLLYCLLDGLGSFADAWWLEYRIDETRANTAYELTFLLIGLCAIVYVYFIRREKLVRRDGWKAGGAVFETAGQFFYIFAMGANAIIAAPTIAAYSVFSVLWSRIFLKEKLSAAHYAVIAGVIGGILTLAFFE